MYEKIKNILGKNKKLYFFFDLLRRLPAILIMPVVYGKIIGKHKKPTVLQLPITYKCNFDCVMCGMQKLSANTDFTPDELGVIISNKLFKEIKFVGINGGEPFLKDNLLDYIQVLINKLPRLRSIHFISNGYFTRKIIDELIKIKQLCNGHNVKITIALSVDAIGELQDLVRGRKNAYTNINETCDALLKHPEQYYDYISIICTITKHNVYNLNEVEIWAEEKGIDVNYNIATIHERVCNGDKYNDFTIFNDPLALRMAAEFFYAKYREAYSQKYFCLYYFILHKKRLAQCEYQGNTGVTLTPNKQLGYCATFSKELGDASLSAANKIFHGNMSYKRQLCSEHCRSCSHYMSSVNREGLFIYLKEIINGRRILY